MKKLLFILSYFFFTLVDAQEPAIQFGVSNPLNINPAYAASIGWRRLDGKVFMGLENQKNPFENSYSFSIDHHFDALAGSIGLVVNSQYHQKGLVKLLSFKGIYSYILPITRKFYIRTAIQPGYELKSTVYDPIRFQFVPENFKYLNPVLYDSALNGYAFNSNRDYFTLGAGFLFQFPKLELGINAQNINRPHWSFNQNSYVRKPFYLLIHAEQYFFEKNSFVLYGKAFYSHQGIEQTYGAALQLKYKRWMGLLGCSNLERYDRNRIVLQAALACNWRKLSLRYGINGEANRSENPIYHTASIYYQIYYRTGACYPRRRFSKFNDFTF